MEVLVSGQAGGFFVSGPQPMFYNITETETSRFSTSRSDLIFAGCNDVRTLPVSSVQEATIVAEREWSIDRAKRLFLLLIDVNEPISEIVEIAECIEDFLSDKLVAEALADAMHASALPPSSIKPSLADFLSEFPQLSQFWDTLQTRQEVIGQVAEAYENVPLSHFAGPQDREGFRRYLVLIGAFRKVAEAIGDDTKVNFLILTLTGQLRGRADSAELIAAWLAPFKVGRRKRRHIGEDIEQFSPETDTPRHGSRKIFENIKLQQKGIVDRLKLRDVDGARRFASELIRQQRTHSTDEQIGKSLCSLAQEAKLQELFDLELEWATQATEVSPGDHKTFGHLADALINNKRWDEAEEALAQTGALGDMHFAKNGKARILREVEKFEDARNLFLEAAREFENTHDVIHSFAGAAETLRDMGRLDEALVEYEELVRRWPTDYTLRSGLAATLVDLGRLSEALLVYSQAKSASKDSMISRNAEATVYKLAGNFAYAMQLYDESVARFPNNIAILAGRADALRMSGDYQSALQAYSAILDTHGQNPIAVAGKAQILLDLREFSEARRIYHDASQLFPNDSRLALGTANTLARMGQYQAALQEFRRVSLSFPNMTYAQDGVARMLRHLGFDAEALSTYDHILQRRPEFQPSKLGRASLLVSMDRFDEAEANLPSSEPRSEFEWTAFLLRMIALKKRGRIGAAIAEMRKNAGKVPFTKSRQLIKSTLAKFELEQGKQFVELQLPQAGTTEISNVIQFQTLAVRKDKRQAFAMYQSVRRNTHGAAVLDLAAEIARRYSVISGRPKHDSNWVYKQIDRSLLLEAA